MNAKIPTAREVFDDMFDEVKSAALRCVAERLDRELRVYTQLSGTEREKKLFQMIDHQKQVIKNLRQQRTVLLKTLEQCALDGSLLAKAMIEQFEGTKGVNV